MTATYRVLENEEYNRVAVRIDSPADDAMVNAAITYAANCDEPITETMVTEAEIESIIKVGQMIPASEVPSYFGLDRDD